MPAAFRYDLIPPGCAVLCALSGGADSMYLLCRLLEGAQRGQYTVYCAHYNHRLRAAAEQDEAFVRAWCRARGVPLFVGSGDVAAAAAAHRLGTEACARTMRYAFLHETAESLGCTLIATGHHAGDQAETVLMNLIRGCGLAGLCGIPERRGALVRPMLGITRAEIDTYLAANSVPHVEDETNSDLNYTRNKLRQQVLPLLSSINPRTAEHLCALAARARADEALLSAQAEALLSHAVPHGGGWAIPASVLADAPAPLALRACRALMQRAGLSPGAAHLETTLALAAQGKSGQRVNVPGGTVCLEQGRLSFASAPPASPPAPVPLCQGATFWGGWHITCTPAVCPPKAYRAPNEFYLRPGSYVVRSRRLGDRLRLGQRPEKTIKALMIEKKIPQSERTALPVLSAGDRAAALACFGPDRDFLAGAGEACLHIILSRREKHEQ